MRFRAVSWLAWIGADHSPVLTQQNLSNDIAREAVEFFAERGIVIEVGTVPTREFLSSCVDALEAAGVEPDIVRDFREYYALAVDPRAAASDDVVAESSATDDTEVEQLNARVRSGDFAVPDAFVTAKTRGSAQRLFADMVKPNYGWRCALTGIATREFLVASHIVPWSDDESIRLDPANGICLSTLVDKAFDTGFLVIREDYSVHIDWNRVGADRALRAALEPYDGQKLTLPTAAPPNPDFLRRGQVRWGGVRG